MSFLLEHFSGTEELSKHYEFDLALLSQQSDVKLKSLIGSQATVEIELADGSYRHVNGFINRFSTQGSDGSYVRYAAVLGAWLWMLTCRFDTRIFQEKKSFVEWELYKKGDIPVDPAFRSVMIYKAVKLESEIQECTWAVIGLIR